jgi:hypothetical protein
MTFPPRPAHARVLVLVCRAGSSTGLGHLQRCRVLAEAARARGHEARVVCRLDAHGVDLPARPDEVFLTAEDLLEPHLPRVAGHSVFVVDARTMSQSDLITLRARARWLVLTSPIFEGAPGICFDLVVSRGDTGRTPAHRRAFFGLEFAVFEPLTGLPVSSKHVTPNARPRLRLGVSFGGSDPGDLTRQVLQALNMQPASPDIVVCLGPAYVHDVRRLEAQGDRVEVCRTPDVHAVWRALADCGLVLLSGGLMALEAAHLGLPSVNIPRSDADRALLRPLVTAGAALVCDANGSAAVGQAVSVAVALLADGPHLAAMQVAGLALRLGHGAERVIALIEHVCA